MLAAALVVDETMRSARTGFAVVGAVAATVISAGSSSPTVIAGATFVIARDKLPAYRAEPKSRAHKLKKTMNRLIFMTLPFRW